MFKDHSKIMKGLSIVKTMVESMEEEDIFVNTEVLVDIIDFLSEYTSTHKAEINKALDSYNEINEQ